MNSDGEEVMCDGKSFHIRAPGTVKARRPTVEMNRLSVTEDRSLLCTGMTKVKMSKEEAGSNEFIEHRRSALERFVLSFLLYLLLMI